MKWGMTWVYEYAVGLNSYHSFNLWWLFGFLVYNGHWLVKLTYINRWHPRVSGSIFHSFRSVKTKKVKETLDFNHSCSVNNLSWVTVHTFNVAVFNYWFSFFFNYWFSFLSKLVVFFFLNWQHRLFFLSFFILHSLGIYI